MAPRLAGRLTAPTLKRVRKIRDFLITEQPSDLRDRQLPVGQIAICEIEPQSCQEVGKGQPFQRQAPCKCSLPNSEPPGDYCGPGFSVRQQRRYCILDARPKRTAAFQSFGKGIFAIADQEFVEIWICADDRQSPE